MTSRERVLTSMRRRLPDRVPRHLQLSPSQEDALRQHQGSQSAEEFFGLDVRILNPLPVKEVPDISSYLPELPQGSLIDDWGVAWTRPGFYHFLGMTHPLRDVTDTAQIEDYPFPNLVGEYRFEGFGSAIDQAHADGKAVRVDCTPLGGTVLWPAYKLRGMEALLMDMVAYPELATVLLDRVTAIVCDYARRLCRFDVDILWLADDYGTQRGLLCSVPMWREWFGSRLRRVVEAAKAVRPDVLVALHSDGAVQELIPDLIEIGIDILNPVQPECMDPVEVKREYGRDIAFWGTIGTQTTLPFGTPEEVRSTVKRMISEVGHGGGLLVAPTHVVEPEVPWANLLALRDALDEIE